MLRMGGAICARAVAPAAAAAATLRFISRQKGFDSSNPRQQKEDQLGDKSRDSNKGFKQSGQQKDSDGNVMDRKKSSGSSIKDQIGDQSRDSKRGMSSSSGSGRGAMSDESSQNKRGQSDQESQRGKSSSRGL